MGTGKHMLDIIVVFVGALALLFAARKIARRVGLVDKPNARKHHSGHIPLVGGVSIYFSLWLLYSLQPGWLPELGDMPSLPAIRTDVEPGELCRFLPRCGQRVAGRCDTAYPPRRMLSAGNEVLCHLDEKALLDGQRETEIVN